MIVSCPNCGARYRLSPPASVASVRMRCAACDHRWLPAADDPGDAIETLPAAPAETPASPAPDDESGAAEPEPNGAAGGAVLRTLAAIVIGSAMAIAAGALWIARIEPSQLPLVGDRIAALSTPALPLKIEFTAQTTPLGANDRLLAIAGTVRNTGTRAVILPDLEARLAGPGGTVRRWRIAAPAARLAPGAAVGFASTTTGFAADATLVGIRPAG